MSSVQCGQCNRQFECGRQDAGSGCWCRSYPCILPFENTMQCLCPQCLSTRIAKVIESRLASGGLDELLQLAGPYQSEGRLIENIDYTIESGQYVFSSWYHLKRGHCCANGCRHCPFEHVAENLPGS